MFEQRFEAQGTIHALAHARGLFRDRQGNVAPAAVLTAAGIDQPSPPLPEYVLTWAEADARAATAVEGRPADAQPP